MISFILRIIFFYILFLFIRSLLKSLVMKKVKSNFENFARQQQDTHGYGGQSQQKKNDGDAIEAEYRKL